MPVEVFFVSRSLRLLLGNILVFHAGWYLVLPFFAVLFTTQRRLLPSDVGMLLAAQSVFLMFGTLFSARLSRWLGRRTTMTGGLFIRAIGLLGLGFGTLFPTLMLSSIVTGFGGGLFAPTVKAALAMATPVGRAEEAFSWRSVAATIGTGIGPLAGGLLLGNIPLLFGVAAALHVALAIGTVTLMENQVEERVERDSIGDVLRDLPFFAFIHNVGWMWALFAQLGLSVPLYAGRVLGMRGTIGLLFSAGSLMLILLQIPVTRLLVRRLQPMSAMALGTGLMALGFGLVGFTRSFATLLMAVLVVVLGQMIAVPTSDAVVSAMARPGAVGSYFALATLAWGLGEAFGVWSGGLVMEFSLGTGKLWLPWAIAAGAGGITALLFLALSGVAPVERGTPRQVVFDRPSPQDGVPVNPAGREGEESLRPGEKVVK